MQSKDQSTLEEEPTVAAEVEVEEVAWHEHHDEVLEHRPPENVEQLELPHHPANLPPRRVSMVY